jgi:hypothetical protein
MRPGAAPDVEEAGQDDLCCAHTGTPSRLSEISFKH